MIHATIHQHMLLASVVYIADVRLYQLIQESNDEVVAYIFIRSKQMFAGVCKLYIRKRIHCKHNDKPGDLSSSTT